jgi:hypothetical protein
MANTTLTLDAVAMLKQMMRQIQANIDFAYPPNHRQVSCYDGARGHTALVSIQGNIRAIEALLDNLKEST